MVSAHRFRKFPTPQWPGHARIRGATTWIMILAIVPILLLPVASRAEMAQPQISDSVGVGLLAGLVVFLVAVGLLSRKSDAAPTTQEQTPGSVMEPPQDAAPSLCPAGTVALISW